jgi:hypothetical protein
VHTYPLHDLVMAVAGGICGVAVMAAIEDVMRTIHTSEKDPV